MLTPAFIRGLHPDMTIIESTLKFISFTNHPFNVSHPDRWVLTLPTKTDRANALQIVALLQQNSRFLTARDPG